jgi:hypothetical protein
LSDRDYKNTFGLYESRKEKGCLLYVESYVFGAAGPSAFAGYHLPTCAPPFTCSTSPVT